MLLLSYSPQLFYFPKFRKGYDTLPKLEPMATGVLFVVDNNYFLVTARHVFADAHLNDIAIMREESVVNLGGEIQFFIMPDKQDNIDLAVVKLHPEVAAIISKSYSFLPYQSIAFDHIHNHTELYFCFGFVNSQQKVLGKVVEQVPFGFYTQLKQINNYTSYGFQETENISLRYNRRNQGMVGADNISHGPRNLEGLSGGGIWNIIRTGENRHIHNCSLVGIMIEQRQKEGMIVGTKIHLLAELLLKGFGI